MKKGELDDWLSYIQTIHKRSIEMGLERSKAVIARLHLRHPCAPIISIAGTNGKGSTVAALEALAMQSGLRIVTYTSPHLVHFNERMRLNGQMLADDLICQAFEAVEAARQDIPLTYFEFCTLAAMVVFERLAPDLIVLEVGMGGRLDTVNCWDADIAIICTIDIDHSDWLGANRQVIAREKSGILRSGKPVLCCDRDPTSGFYDYQKEIGALLYLFGRDFGVETGTGIFYQSAVGERLQHQLPNQLAIRQCYLACALQAMALLQPCLAKKIKPKLATALQISIPGRLQSMSLDAGILFDVAHNPQAIASLADYLHRQPVAGHNYGVFYAMEDKPLQPMLLALGDRLDTWFLGAVEVERAASDEQMQTAFRQTGLETRSRFYSHIVHAYEAASAVATKDDRIVVFGSFYVVGAIMQHLNFQPYAHSFDHGC